MTDGLWIGRVYWQSPARSVAIVAHGKPGNVAAFYRRRERIAS